MFWLGLATGLVVGASLGAVIMGCLAAAKRTDKTAERDCGEHQLTSVRNCSWIMARSRRDTFVKDGGAGRSFT